MAPRPYWKGYLKLSLVTCPVSLTPATSEGEKVRFHTINAETGHRVRSQYVDAETGKPISDEDEVRGYEVEKDRHVSSRTRSSRRSGSRAPEPSTSSSSSRPTASSGFGMTRHTT